MRDEAVLGIDVGTTLAKAGIVALDGRLLGIGRAAYPVAAAEPGRAEQDPAAWWDAIVAATHAALGAIPPADRPRIRSIAVAGQGPTTVLADRDGDPVRPAITWQDARAGAIASALAERLGVPAWQLGPLPHERWIAAHEPAVHAAMAWALTPWDWVTMRLCGEAVRAVPPGAGNPSDALIAAGGGDPARFGRATGWATVVGRLLPAPAAALGLPPGIAVVAGGNDAFASFHGAGMARPGDAIDTGGTSGGFGVYWHTRLEIPGTYRSPAALPGTWLYGGAMSATGRALDWLAEACGPAGRPAPVETLLAEAAATPPGAEGLVFLPYLAGERSPIWDDRARGAFAGLTLVHRRGHLARAVLEGAAFALRHVAEPILAAGVGVRTMVVSGRAGATPLATAIKADVTGFPVAVPEVPETALLGAAILAAIGDGAWPDAPAAMAGMVRIAARIEPRAAVRDRYDATFAAYRELWPAVAPIAHRLGDG